MLALGKRLRHAHHAGRILVKYESLLNHIVRDISVVVEIGVKCAFAYLA